MTDQRAAPANLTLGVKSALGWTALAGTLGLLLLVVAPGRGAGWIQDDGLFLRMSWDAAHGYGLDHMLPQSPSYLFHAALMNLGLSEYLHFRYVNYLVIALSTALFFIALTPTPSHPLVPLSILASLLASLNSVLNPNSLSMAFWLSATGCYFWALRSQSRLAIHTLYALAGILFGFAGFMHAAVIVAMLLIVMLILALDHTARRSLLLPLFLLNTVVPWYLYARAVGLKVLLSHPAGHDASPEQIFTRIGLLLFFYIKPLLLFMAFHHIWRRRQDAIAYTRRTLSWVFTIWVLLSMATFLTDSSLRFPGWVGISQIPGVLLVLLYLAFFEWAGLQLGQAWSLKPASQRLRWLTHSGWRALQAKQDRKLFLAFMGLILVPAALAVGSNTAIIQGMVFFSGPAFGVLLLLWFHLGNARLLAGELTLAAIWLLVLGGFAFSYNHPNYSRPLTPGLEVLRQAPLQGIRESVTYQQSLEQLQKAYLEFGCAGHTLLALDYLPMVYFILQHPAPQDIGVIRPQMYFPEEKILRLLDNDSAWCVLDATGVETQADTDSRQGSDVRDRVRARVKQLALFQTVIAAPSEEILSPMTLYARNHTTVKVGAQP